MTKKRRPWKRATVLIIVLSILYWLLLGGGITSIRLLLGIPAYIDVVLPMTSEQVEKWQNQVSLKSGVQLYFRGTASNSYIPKTTYKTWEEKIIEAQQKGSMKKYPSGIVHYDFGTTQGIMLPLEQAPTVNDEPVFFECTKWRELRNSKVGGGCTTLYFYKKGLQISYDETEVKVDTPDFFLERDQRFREQIEAYLKDNPEFYYNRVE